MAEKDEDALKRARVAFDAGNFNEAAGICRDVLGRSPNNGEAMATLGAAVSQTGDVAQGIALLEKAGAGNSSSPVWLSMLGSLYRLENRLEEATTLLTKAVSLAPDNVSFRRNLGLVHHDCGRDEEAAECFLALLGRDGADADTHLALAEVLLAQGEMRAGWAEYRWLHETARHRQLTESWPKMTTPAWNGMPLRRGTLVLVADQGYGDALQFSRYVPWAAGRCQQVAIMCDRRLHPLLSRIPGVATCTHVWRDMPPHAAHAYLSRLPGLAGTEMETIPAPSPYLAPDPARAAAWASRLAAQLPPGRLRVGLVWAGRPTHANDRRRSLRLAQLAPITAVPGVTFVSLQVPPPPRDAAVMAGLSDLLDVSADLTDFGETAAVIDNLDLVITVDSAVAHVTGAIGRSAWVLLPQPNDWRWLRGRENTPWYPTLRLFRQPAPGQWEAPIAAAAASLARLAAVQAAPTPRSAPVPA